MRPIPAGVIDNEHRGASAGFVESTQRARRNFCVCTHPRDTNPLRVKLNRHLHQECRVFLLRAVAMMAAIGNG